MTDFQPLAITTNREVKMTEEQKKDLQHMMACEREAFLEDVYDLVKEYQQRFIPRYEAVKANKDWSDYD